MKRTQSINAERSDSAPESSRHEPGDAGLDAALADAARAGGPGIDEGEALERANPVRELIKVAAPTVATMMSYTMMQFVDKLIVSGIGPDPVYVGAQGEGGIAAWVPISIAMGTITVVNTFVSQNLGARTPERAPAYAWAGVWMSLIWALVLIPYGVALPSIFAALGREGDRLEFASQYGQILVFGAGLSMCTRALAQYFYGMHRPSIVLIAGVAANLLNLGLSYLLVHGYWGLPKLGVAGSAVGTVIATGLELSIPLSVFLSARFNRLYGTRAAWRPSMMRIKEILKLGWPGGLMFGNEMVCWTFFMVVLVGHFGKLHSTAGWIAHQWMTLSFMPAVGISVAVTATVGRCMGARRPDLAAKRAYVGLALALAYMGACGAAFVMFREPMVRLFIESSTPQEDAAVVVGLGSKMLIAAAAFQLFDATAMVFSGALRGAGDTVWPGVATVILAWAVIVGGGVSMVRWAPQLESVGPWIAAAAYIASLCVMLTTRFLSGKWRSIRLVGRRAEETQDAGYTVDGVV